MAPRRSSQPSRWVSWPPPRGGELRAALVKTHIFVKGPSAPKSPSVIFVAGTETLVVSLWQVADKETGDLMKTYYQKLRQGKNRVAALQQAMTEMAGKKSHPYYWAPFIALGRDEPLR